MASYLERLCIFICLGDLLANFLPSEKFAKLYRHVAGALILLLIVQPLGKEAAGLLENTEGSIFAEFEERMAGQDVLWEIGSEEAFTEETENALKNYLGQMTDEEIKEELIEYGYEVDEDSPQKERQ